MFGQAHAGLGWAVGVLTPGSDRRLRGWCFTAALLPDIDAAPFLLGKEYYDAWHRTFGHNVWLGMLVVAAAWWHGRDLALRRRAFLAGMTALCFASHILTDMKFSGWETPIFWPVSPRLYQFVPNYDLGHWINFFFAYFFMGLAVVLPLFRGVTPLELLSPRLDRMFLNCFRRRTLECATCTTLCNNRCDGCEAPVCARHGRIAWYFRLVCPKCTVARKEGSHEPEG